MKKEIYLIGILSILIHTGYGQKKVSIDSLLQVYETTLIDSVQLKTANRITSYYLYRDIKKAEQYARLQLDMGRKQKDLAALAKANHQMSIIYGSLSNYDSTLYYINKTLDLARKTGNKIQESISRHSRVLLELDKGNMDLALTLNTENLAFNRSIQDTLGIALSYDTQGSIYTEKDQYLLALNSVRRGLGILTALGDRIRIADANHKLAIIENSLEHYPQALDYSQKAFSIYQEFEDLEYQAASRNVMGISYKGLKKNSEAFDQFQKSLEIAEEQGYKSIALTSLAHLSDLRLDEKNNRETKALIDKGLSIAREINYDQMISYFDLRKAIYYKNTKQFALAHRFLDSTLSRVPEDSESRSSIFKIRSEVFEEQKAFAQSLSFFQKHKQIQDSSSRKKNTNRINELRILHQAEQKEAEIALQEEEIKTLEEKERASALSRKLYGLGMFSVVGLTGLVLFGYNQKMKRNAAERQKQEEILRKEIEHKQKELASQTLHLVQKNTFLQELKENLEKMKSSPEKFKTEYRRIAMLLKKENSSDKDWEVFKTYFAEVHNDFDQKLKTLFADISEKDIRLAAFLRMNLTTKEIAATMNVLPESILKSKYRLKQKLGLDKDTDLVSFLSTL